MQATAQERPAPDEGYGTRCSRPHPCPQAVGSAPKWHSWLCGHQGGPGAEGREEESYESLKMQRSFCLSLLSVTITRVHQHSQLTVLRSRGPHSHGTSREGPVHWGLGVFPLIGTGILPQGTQPTEGPSPAIPVQSLGAPKASADCC